MASGESSVVGHGLRASGKGKERAGQGARDQEARSSLHSSSLKSLTIAACWWQATKEALADLSDLLHVGGSTVDERYKAVMDWVQGLGTSVSAAGSTSPGQAWAR